MNSEDKIKKALIILLSQKNFDKISVTEICDEAHVSRVTFYKNFVDRQDVLNQIINEFTKKLDNVFSNRINVLNPIDFSNINVFKSSLMPHVLEIISFLYHEKDVIQVFMTTSSEVDILKIIYDLFLTHFKTWLPQKFHLNYSPETLNQYCDFLTRGSALLIGNWFRKKFKQSPQEITTILVNMIAPNLYGLYHRDNH
ncbi:TetR/AcrR family transcriptional regulator [Enterococcus thailandicus]|uniref:TetR/AcrR family transcriptional regulator n=2 Tax=Enterococcus thailandicus TaxID=417368 RepID=UPI0022E319BB|nr:TetR/AcrR family transcriptional regulator [Enterococcus thailandicus]